MRVTVRLFASHRERTGQSVMILDLPDDACVEDVFTTLAGQYPGFEELRSWTTFACNRRMVSADEPLADGDEVALLQPVSGGEQ
jgi:molybdopterin converting factor small subunit